ncbi:glycosyltransferase family 2 protein [Paenibacillus sp. P96]|uniref:Glycosyltransferase family 2 protein n=1 Tax=Paenibacillus zeirhizosphaerae TaxID=2987519 RepID=A0ABT9FXK8_9BACL|nr:glycosyltransferase family 2 protein [Paenibacillus sp. P96]MDP4099369.1 glycosyltransferase family 2 protein [Paenibacillus sp. P96]
MTQELLTLAILAKDKAHVLPLYLKMIERQTYPSSSINLYIRTNNNNDHTAEILKNWVDRVKDDYHEVYFDDGDVEEPVQEYSPHDWNALKLKVLGRIRMESIQWAMERGTHYAVVDCDNFIAPDTLESLMNTGLPAVAPLLKVAEVQESNYSNFHHLTDANGYYIPSDPYFQILYRAIIGLIQVDVIHCTYLIRKEVLPYARYDDDSARFEYVIFSQGLRNAGIPQYIDNRRIYGALTFVDTAEDFVEKNVEHNFYLLAELPADTEVEVEAPTDATDITDAADGDVQ